MARTPDSSLNKLHVAVLDGNLREIEKLSKSRALRNEKTSEGCTALMLAALTRNAVSVAILIRNRADFREIDVAGRTAREYCKNNSFTHAAAKFFLDRGFALKPKLLNLRSAGREIQRIFRDPEALRAVYRRGDHALSKSYIFYDSTSSLILFPSMIRIPLGDDIGPSTVGFVSGYGGTAINMAAMSGWKTQRTSISGHFLNKEEYTGLVRDACRITRFKLPGTMNDNGAKPATHEQKGRYHASHVEKKLAIYWVKHALEQCLGTTNLARMGELKELPNLPDSIRRAKIFLTRRACKTCTDFLIRIRAVTGLDLCLEELPRLVRYNRSHLVKACPNCGFARGGEDGPSPNAHQFAASYHACSDERDNAFEDLGAELGSEAAGESLIELPRLRESQEPESVASQGTLSMHPRGGPTTFTSPCTNWRRYSKNCAKPITERATLEEMERIMTHSTPTKPQRRLKPSVTTRKLHDPSVPDQQRVLTRFATQVRRDETPLPEPVSELDGQSLYFEPPPKIDLDRFRYSSGRQETHSGVRRSRLSMMLQLKRPRTGRVSKDEKIRARSVFLAAARQGAASKET